MGGSREDSVCDTTGEAWDARNLYIVDGAALPTGLGVNPMITIEAAAHKIARGMAAKLT
jgi:choline dehydrogenase-like flavoprotein